MTLAELKTIYANLLISQYRNKTKARATIELMAESFSCDGLLLTLAEAFNIETAVGAQLDIIGKIVGVERNIYGLDLTHTFFEFTSYTGTPVGVDLQRYADATPGPEIMLRYRSTTAYTMSDLEMRALIKLKIIYNTTRQSLKNLTDALYSAFTTGITVTDNLDMTVDFDVTTDYAKVMLVADWLGFVPKPMGVAYTINYI